MQNCNFFVDNRNLTVKIKIVLAEMREQKRGEKMNWDKLKGAVVSRGYGMVEFCDKIGINYVTLYRQSKNNKVSIANVKKIKESLELNGEEVMSIFFEH